jgi:hypothetical protein
MFVGLVRARDWEPPPPPPPSRQPSDLPWRPIAALLGWALLLVVSAALGGFAGYLVLVAAIALGAWRLDRWSRGQYWGGLREHRS